MFDLDCDISLQFSAKADAVKETRGLSVRGIAPIHTDSESKADKDRQYVDHKHKEAVLPQTTRKHLMLWYNINYYLAAFF